MCVSAHVYPSLCVLLSRGVSRQFAAFSVCLPLQGGSHDRTTLLPLKAGVAIMSLTAMQQGADEVLIVPVGLTYHNPHKMQSRASVHIGDPVPVRHTPTDTHI